MRVNSWKFLLLNGLLAGFVAVGLVGNAAADNHQAADRSLFGDGFTALDRVVDTQARLVFYWPKDHPSLQAATILVDGAYHTTLTSGGYSLLCLVPAAIRIVVRQVTAGAHAPGGYGIGAAVQLQPGQTLYWRIRPHHEKHLTFESMDATKAREELQTTLEQIHTISRVISAQVCQDFGSPRP